MASDETTRATFVMTKGSRAMLRSIAARYGIPQSEVMNVAPYLFLIAAERSLKEREHRLVELRAQAEEAKKSLDAMPQHVVLGDARQTIDQAIELEERSIRERQIHGPDDATIAAVTHRYFSRHEDPFARDIFEALTSIRAEGAAKRFSGMFGPGYNDDQDDTFVDEEEAEARKRTLEELLDEEIELAGAPTTTDSLSAPDSQRSDRAITIQTPTGRLSAANGAEALEQVAGWIANGFPDGMGVLTQIRGRTRNLVAQDPEKLYPGRPDLAHFSREFTPGWYVGTNYAHREVLRFIRAAAEGVGLTWGVDISVQSRANGEASC